MQCSSGDCHITFHPTCARNSGFYMDTKGFGTTSQHKAYCGKHSAQQKEVNLSILSNISVDLYDACFLLLAWTRRCIVMYMLVLYWYRSVMTYLLPSF
jgi:hypothetical protein